MKRQVILIFLCAALLGLGASYAYHNNPLNDAPGAIVKRGNFDAIQTRVQSSVVVYGTTSCPACQQARALLSFKGVRYADMPVDASPAANQEAKSLGAQRVPFILIGNSSIEGFNEEQILQLLAEHKLI